MADIAALNVLIRGAGGMASGIAVRLMRSGISRICMLEQPRPRAVQRLASFSDAVYEGFSVVEGVTAALVQHPRELPGLWSSNCLGILIDPAALCLRALRPTVCIDATGDRQGVFSLTDAPLVIGLRPAHQPGLHAHVVIETSGPGLGRVLRAHPATEGQARSGPADLPEPCAFSLHAPHEGVFRTGHDIGEYVRSGQVIGHVHNAGLPASRMSSADTADAYAVIAPVSGTLRGILRDYTPVTVHSRLARIDPRDDVSCHQISDRALAVGGGVLEAILGALHKRPQPHGGILR